MLNIKIICHLKRFSWIDNIRSIWRKRIERKKNIRSFYSPYYCCCYSKPIAVSAFSISIRIRLPMRFISVCCCCRLCCFHAHSFDAVFHIYFFFAAVAVHNVYCMCICVFQFKWCEYIYLIHRCGLRRARFVSLMCLTCVYFSVYFKCAGFMLMLAKFKTTHGDWSLSRFMYVQNMLQFLSNLNYCLYYLSPSWRWNLASLLFRGIFQNKFKWMF